MRRPFPTLASLTSRAPNTLQSETLQSFPVLSSGATVDDTGGVNISLVNVDLVNTRSIDITLNGSTPSYVVSNAQVITGAAKDTYNDFDQPEAVNAQPLSCCVWTRASVPGSAHDPRRSTGSKDRPRHLW